MNLRPYYKSVYKPDLFWLTIALLNILLAIVLVYFLFIHPKTPAYDMAVQAVKNLEHNNDYELYIHEQADTQSLSFRGKIDGNNLSGTIPEYDVVVFFKGDRLYVRNAKDTPWENSEAVELDKLKAFLITPHEMFHLINSYIDEVQLGPEKGREDSIYKTIYWTIDSEEFWSVLFPAIDTSHIEEGIFSAEISARNFDIHRVKITLVMEAPEEDKKQIIQRTLSLTPVNQKV